MIPQIGYVIRMPKALGSAAGLQALHRRCAKHALMAELVYHHRRRFPKHYDADARLKYRHKPRDPKYLAMKKKRFRGTRDHIKTNKSRRAMLANAKFIIGGSGTGQYGLIGRIRMRFPFAASFDNSPNKVNLRQMAHELSTITNDEQREISTSFGQTYTKHFLAGLTPRLAKKVGVGFTSGGGYYG